MGSYNHRIPRKLVTAMTNSNGKSIKKYEVNGVPKTKTETGMKIHPYKNPKKNPKMAN